MDSNEKIYKKAVRIHQIKTRTVILTSENPIDLEDNAVIDRLTDMHTHGDIDFGYDCTADLEYHDGIIPEDPEIEYLLQHIDLDEPTWY